MMTITVVLPVYNEGPSLAARLVTIFDALSVYRSGGYDFRYVLVDDGSIDDTFEMARSFARGRRNVEVLRHPENRGLGAALRTAFAGLCTEFVIVLDSDLSYHPATGMVLLEALERENADIALASAYMPAGDVKNVPWLRRLLSREANRLLSLAANGRCATLTCMVRAYRTDALRRIQFGNDRMEAVAEILLVALRRNLRVVEVPATLRWSEERCAAPSRIRPVRTLQQVWETIRLAFAYRPALWLTVPGLVPGLLPLVVAALLIARVPPTVFLAATAVTIFLQYASLAILAGQLGTFFTRAFVRNRRHQKRKVHHDCSTRIA